MRAALIAFSMCLLGASPRIDTASSGKVSSLISVSGIDPIGGRALRYDGPMATYHAETLDYIARVEAAGGGLTPTQESAIDTFVRSAPFLALSCRFVRRTEDAFPKQEEPI